MKDLIKSVISGILQLLIVALMCNIIFNTSGLAKLFNMYFNYTQWVSIVAIAGLLFSKKSTSSDDK